MDDFFNLDGMLNLGTRWFLDAALRHIYVFLMVLFRLSGLMTTGPIFSQSVVPPRARVGLIVALSCMLTPLMQDSLQHMLASYDRNQDGRLTLAEAPQHMRQRVLNVAAETKVDPEAGVPILKLANVPIAQYANSELLRSAASEFGLGFVLGLGVMIVLTGLQLAGQIIDQQIGIDAASVLNPDLGGAALSSQTFFMLGSVAILLMEPMGGHLMLLEALTESFDSIPIGHVAEFSTLHVLVTELIHKSLVLGVQVCSPLLATMSLVTLSMGYLGHSVPQFNQLVVGMPIRSLIGILVLAMTLSGTARVVIDTVPDAIHHIQDVLESPADDDELRPS